MWQPTLIIVGIGGTGKTMPAKMLAHVLNKKMPIVTNRDDFKRYDDTIEMLVFDDFGWSNLNGEQVLNAIDTTDARTMNVKNGHVMKKAGLI